MKKQLKPKHARNEAAEKWIQHYSSMHQILLVGDGDFSFSLCLAKAFGSASNIVATSLDTYDVLIKNYPAAKPNLESLRKLGATVIHGVDATKMKLFPDLQWRNFDRIIYNFPHAGFHGREDDIRMIKMHQELVLDFFKNASRMLKLSGKVHINHKTEPPYNKWNLKDLAGEHNLALVGCVEFRKEDYPGYKNKKGAGPKCDESFPLGECSTFKFKFSHNVKKSAPNYIHTSLNQIQQRPSRPQNQFLYDVAYPLAEVNRPSNFGYFCTPYAPEIYVEPHTIFPGYSMDTEIFWGRTGYHIGQDVHETLRTGFDRYM